MFEDVQVIGTRDVFALADRVQQERRGAIDGLRDVIATSPVLASSSAAYVLSMVLIKDAGSDESKSTALMPEHTTPGKTIGLPGSEEAQSDIEECNKPILAWCTVRTARCQPHDDHVGTRDFHRWP